MSYRRKSKRFETAIPLRLVLLGMSKPPPTIETVTTNISPVGISLKLQVTLSEGVFNVHNGETSVNLIPYLVLEKKEVSLEITLPPHGEKITGRGKIVWYDLGSREGAYYFNAGIFIRDMAIEDRKRWERFIKDTALKTITPWHYMQIASAFAFIAGIVVFIISFWAKLAATAKIGIFISFIGLLCFCIGWWRHRSFMLFKKFKLF